MQSIFASRKPLHPIYQLLKGFYQSNNPLLFKSNMCLSEGQLDTTHEHSVYNCVTGWPCNITLVLVL